MLRFFSIKFNEDRKWNGKIDTDLYYLLCSILMLIGQNEDLNREML